MHIQPTGTRTVRLMSIGLAATAALMVGITACSGTTHNAGATSSAGASSSAAAAGPASSSSPSAATSAPATTPAPSASATIPDLAGIVVTAKATSSQVSELHDIAVSAGHPGSIPASVIPSTASAVLAKLRTQITACTALKPAPSSPPGLLASSLQGYVTLATQVSKWDAGANQPLSTTFFDQLKVADADWTGAMKAVGGAAHQDLLSDVPPLLYPKS